MIRKITLLFLLCLGAGELCFAQTGEHKSTSDTISITIAAGYDSSCTGSPVTFTAHADSSLPGVKYAWYVDSVATGVTTPTFTTSTLADSDTVYCYIYFASGSAIDTVISNMIVVRRFASVTPSLAITVTEGNNPGCPGYPILFTATSYFGGPSPSFQWIVNGTPAAGATFDTFSGVFNSGDMITCALTSSLACASAMTDTSAPVTISHVTLPASISISTTTPTHACQSNPIPYYATVENPGSGATYQWYVNGSPISGATDQVYTTSTLTGTVTVQCVLLAPDSCISNHTAISNIITDTFYPSGFPSVMSSITSGSNPDCLDSNITFSAVVSNFGPDPVKVWYLNGVPVDTGLTYSSSSFSTGDVISYLVTSTDKNCYSPDTIRTTPVTISVIYPAAAPHISLIGNTLWGNSVGTYQWYGPKGLIPGATDQSYFPDTTGTYYAVITDSGCASARSNALDVTALGIGTYNISQVSIYPNPTMGQLTLNWNGRPATMQADIYNATGQGLIHSSIVHQTIKTFDLSTLPIGNYILVLTDESGKTATVKVTVVK